MLTLAGFVLLAVGFYAGYQLGISSTLADRVRMWQSPWDNAARGGDQIAQALWALATGGTWGTGLGLGDTRYLPAGHTDLVLAAVAEELGFSGLLAIGLVYVALVRRGFTIARRASTDYAVFLATGLTLLLAVPAALMMAGLLGLVPLTGVVTPFLSYGGSAMLANFAALGALAVDPIGRATVADVEPLGQPSALDGRACWPLPPSRSRFVAVRVQVLAADEIVVRPHLGDAGRRLAPLSVQPARARRRARDPARARPRSARPAARRRDTGAGRPRTRRVSAPRHRRSTRAARTARAGAIRSAGERSTFWGTRARG